MASFVVDGPPDQASGIGGGLGPQDGDVPAGEVGRLVEPEVVVEAGGTDPIEARMLPVGVAGSPGRAVVGQPGHHGCPQDRVVGTGAPEAGPVAKGERVGPALDIAPGIVFGIIVGADDVSTLELGGVVAAGRALTGCSDPTGEVGLVEDRSFGPVEGSGQGYERLAVLGADDPAADEGGPVPQSLDRVVDRSITGTGGQENGVERLGP